jgi:hypothetical protein
MAEANVQQIQQFANERVRPHSELARQLVLAFDSDRASIDDIYQALNGSQAGWVDGRTDGPPHLLAASDVLAFNQFAEDVRTFMKAHGQYAVVLKACVRAPQG